MDRATSAAYFAGMDHDHDLDARGLLCPLPVLKAAKRMRGLDAGQVLRLLADDPAAAIDVPHYCAENGHSYLGMEPDGEAQAYYLRKSG